MGIDSADGDQSVQSYYYQKLLSAVPRELEESAKIDGCSEIGVFWRIALPLSKPVIATFALFYAVGIWNDFFHALLYINDSAKWPPQMVLRQVTILSDLTATNGDTMQNTVPPEQGLNSPSL